MKRAKIHCRIKSLKKATEPGIIKLKNISFGVLCGIKCYEFCRKIYNPKSHVQVLSSGNTVTIRATSCCEL